MGITFPRLALVSAIARHHSCRRRITAAVLFHIRMAMASSDCAFATDPRLWMVGTLLIQSRTAMRAVERLASSALTRLWRLMTLKCKGPIRCCS